MRPLLCAAALLPALAAAAPVELTHAGRLLDPTGQPLNGPATLAVRLAPSQTAAPTWTDTFNVSFQDGFFTVVLGSGAPLDTADLDAPEVWVETAVDGTVLGPRTRLLAVPFAGIAHEARALTPGATARGALLLGTETDTWCTPGREGALIFDPALNRLKVCLGSSGWQVVGASRIVEVGGVRQWEDGTYATACWSYRSPPDTAHLYLGATGDGVYRVDPDGLGGVAPFDVYCDMTTDGGGWTLVDNDATNAATFGSRTAGTITDPAVTGGRLLPGYDWSADPLLLCRASYFTGTSDWITLSAGGPIAREYPTAVTQTNYHDGGWAVRTLNGNTDQGTTSWIYNGSGRFGSVWIGNGGLPTCACNYTGASTGLGAYTAADASTCSTWVR